MRYIVEIRAGEGGHDAKLLVEEQVDVYLKAGNRRSL
jgi:protein subunit release factor A